MQISSNNIIRDNTGFIHRLVVIFERENNKNLLDSATQSRPIAPPVGRGPDILQNSILLLVKWKNNHTQWRNMRDEYVNFSLEPTPLLPNQISRTVEWIALKILEL